MEIGCEKRGLSIEYQVKLQIVSLLLQIAVLGETPVSTFLQISFNLFANPVSTFLQIWVERLRWPDLDSLSFNVGFEVFTSVIVNKVHITPL